MLVADGFGSDLVAHLSIEPAARVFAASLAGKRQSPLAKAFFKKSFIEAGEIADPVDPQRMQILLHHLAHARDVAHVERRKKLCFLPGDDPEHTMRLRLGGRNFGDEARAANPDGTIQLRLGLHLLMQVWAALQRGAVQAFRACHVEIGFVDRSHLHLRRERTQDVMNFLRALAIAVRMSVDKDGLRTKLRRRAQRHGRVHSEFARLIRRCGDHAAFVALSAHHNCFAFQRGIKQLFHRDEEGVHVDVEDGFGGGHEVEPLVRILST